MTEFKLQPPPTPNQHEPVVDSLIRAIETDRVYTKHPMSSEIVNIIATLDASAKRPKDIEEAVHLYVSFTQQLVEDLKERKALGIQRYGVPLQPFNGRDMRRDLREELLDALVYSWGTAMEGGVK